MGHYSTRFGNLRGYIQQDMMIAELMNSYKQSFGTQEDKYWIHMTRYNASTQEEREVIFELWGKTSTKFYKIDHPYMYKEET